VDDIVRPGQTIYSHACDRRPGGKGANQAVAIAKAGGTVSLNGNIGPDGQWMLEHLEAAGVDVTSVNIVEQVSNNVLRVYVLLKPQRHV
jgi:ribokinase